MSIVANKIPGCRAALCNDLYFAKNVMTRNNSNILTLGSKVTDIKLAKDIVKTWLTTDFECGKNQERNIRRFESMMAIDSEYRKKISKNSN